MAQKKQQRSRQQNRRQVERPVRRDCPFCKSEGMPTFHDLKTLEVFVTDRGKIVGRKRSGLCAKHQRVLTKSVKRARYLALLPFSERTL